MSRMLVRGELVATRENTYADKDFIVAVRNGFDPEVRRLFLNRAINDRVSFANSPMWWRERFGPLFLDDFGMQDIIRFMREWKSAP